jgi:hypothetical protein
MVDRNHWRLGRRLRLLPLVAEVKVTLAARRGTSLVDGESSRHVCPAHPISLFEGASAKQPFPNRFAPVLEAPAMLWRLLRRNGPLRKEPSESLQLPPKERHVCNTFLQLSSGEGF